MRPNASGARARTFATCASPAPKRRAQGVTILIEPINARDFPGYLLNTQAQAHAIRSEIGAKNLKVQMDLYHAQIVEGDLTEKLRMYMPHIGHVQIANVPGRTEPDVGEINYGYLFKVLDELKLRRLGRLRIPACQGHGGRPDVALSAAGPKAVDVQGIGLIDRRRRGPTHGIVVHVACGGFRDGTATDGREHGRGSRCGISQRRQ